jgi:hypothetical protein
MEPKFIMGRVLLTFLRKAVISASYVPKKIQINPENHYDR